MIIVNDYDRRQIDLIRKNLKLFYQNSIDLGHLIANLDGLYRSITNVDPEWENLFFEKWIDLECVYASLVNEGNIELNSKDKVILIDALGEIQNLVELALDCYLQTPNPLVSKSAIMLDEMWLMCPDCIDAWESSSQDAMIICPKCDKALHNPRYVDMK